MSNSKVTQIAVKNMVCSRCVRVVKEDLEKQGFVVESISLGQVILSGTLSEEAVATIKKTLEASGFEMIKGSQQKLIELVKTSIIQHIYMKKEKPDHLNFSDFLALETGTSYSNLSRLFSTTEGLTIEKYIILQKIERVKELLVYGEQNLSEIAFDLGYSSVAHLSGQFKKVTGLSPTGFKQLIAPRRQTLDKLTEE